MAGWIGVVVVALVILLAVVVPLVTLALRQRVVTRQGGAFECSMRLRPIAEQTPSSNWVLGVARYNHDRVEWFRFFSFSPLPRMTFRRADSRVIDTRDPEPAESVALYDGQRVVRVAVGAHDSAEVWELAMSSGSLTGFLSWLEAAPPGTAMY
ncbi:DUF2550 domain-containing protein [Microlunatus speluncae]|uniref:DUF2550 domain-containing protein n=1 Tax=Microlunatus speluncae TaxID=2594267 RepID=UPI001266537D|nr:DUF2550 domain-containing protein [Microlunatus speluncae]